MKAPRILMMAQQAVSLQIQFVTDKNGTFDPSISVSDASVATWAVTGETPQVTNTPSFTLTGADETVTLTIADFSKITGIDWDGQNIKGSLDVSYLTDCLKFKLQQNAALTGITNPTNSTIITEYWAFSSNITGGLDLSGFSNLGLSVSLWGNSNMTGITFPTSSRPFNILNIYSCNLTGTLDLSGLTGLGGTCQLFSNPNLTSITFPTSSNSFSSLYAYSCNLTGTIDISGLTGLGGDVRFYSNSSLTSITFPTSSTAFSILSFGSCNITGNIDISGLTGLAGNFNCVSNPNMTGLTLPTSSGAFTFFNAYSCGFTGTLDMSGLAGLAGVLDVHSNSGLTDITLPSTSGNFSSIIAWNCGLGVLNWSALSGSVSSIQIQNNAFTTSESNNNIVDIDTNVNLTTSLNIAGTNAALTTGPPDGIAAKDQLIVEGVSVTYN